MKGGYRELDIMNKTTCCNCYNGIGLITYFGNMSCTAVQTVCSYCKGTGLIDSCIDDKKLELENG